jgi:hypothetical protein
MSQRTPGGGRLIFAFAILSCSTGRESEPSSLAQPIRDPTYYADIQPLVAQHCVKCHSPGGIGPFPLTTYEETSGKASLMSTEVGARRMPPWTAQDSDECTPPFGWRGDERLSEDEISLIRRWAALDAPAGDPPTVTVAVSASDPTSLSAPTYELPLRTPYLPRTDRDDFRCFVLDIPELDAGAWIAGVDVVPGDRRIVHHANAWSDPGGVASAAAGPDGSFDCTDSESLPMNLPWLVSWAPGAKPLELESDIAIEIPPHSKIVMQIHYSVGNRAIAPERTRLQLRVAPSKPIYALGSWEIGNMTAPEVDGDGLLAEPDDPPSGPEFLIPARETGHVEAMTNRMRDTSPMILYGIRAHAHLAATDIKVDRLHTGTPDEPTAGQEREQCLLQDRWDFHWQRVYSYDAKIDDLPRVQPGDRIRLRCTYDNTMTNPRLGQELHDRGLQPTDIYLGDSTLDEMCLADLLFLRKL